MRAGSSPIGLTSLQARFGPGHVDRVVQQELGRALRRVNFDGKTVARRISTPTSRSSATTKKPFSITVLRRTLPATPQPASPPILLANTSSYGRICESQVIR